ncbi:MAG: hypothetical protein Q8P95_00575, partial [bacterium]|nr:hypothetical protein [bacterium]
MSKEGDPEPPFIPFSQRLIDGLPPYAEEHPILRRLGRLTKFAINSAAFRLGIHQLFAVSHKPSDVVRNFRGEILSKISL